LEEELESEGILSKMGEPGSEDKDPGSEDKSVPALEKVIEEKQTEGKELIEGVSTDEEPMRWSELMPKLGEPTREEDSIPDEGSTHEGESTSGDDSTLKQQATWRASPGGTPVNSSTVPPQHESKILV
jgi:hypothetical protein